MLIGLGKDKTPLDFGFTRSKVKVTFVLKKSYHIAFIYHMLIGEHKSPGVFKFTRPKVKVTWVTCDKICKQFLLIILKTINYKA